MQRLKKTSNGPSLKNIEKVNDEGENKWFSTNDLTIYGLGLLLAAVGLYVSNVKEVNKRDPKKSKHNHDNGKRIEIKPIPLSKEDLDVISKLRRREELRIKYFPMYRKTLLDLLKPNKLSEEDKKIEVYLQRFNDVKEEDKLPLYIYNKVEDLLNHGSVDIGKQSMEEMIIAYGHYTREMVKYYSDQDYDSRYFDPSKEKKTGWIQEEAKRRYEMELKRRGVKISDSGE